MKRNFTFYKNVFFILLFMGSFAYSSTAQTCCRAAENAMPFATYCISMVTGCVPNNAPCNTAGMNAAHGVSKNYLTFECVPEAGNCTTGSCNGGFVTLPVELISFETKFHEEGISLEWSTASELTNEGFYIENSRDGTNWGALGFVSGNGTTFEMQKYDFMDDNPYMGLNYYRLKQLDTDGVYEYSDVKVAVWQGGVADLKMVTMPNPARDWMTVVLPPSVTASADDDDEVTYEVFSTTGQLMFSHTNIILAEVRLDLTNLAKGNYILRLRKDGMVHNANFIKVD